MHASQSRLTELFLNNAGGNQRIKPAQTHSNIAIKNIVIQKNTIGAINSLQPCDRTSEHFKLPSINFTVQMPIHGEY